MKRQAKKHISILLLIALLVTIFPVSPAMAEGLARRSDLSLADCTFSAMVDERLDEVQLAEEMRRFEERFPDGIPEEFLPDPDAGKVDRFIVAYKPGHEAAFRAKVGSRLDTAISFDSIQADRSLNLRGRLPDVSAPGLDSETSIGLPVEFDMPSLDNYEIIVLKEAVWPSEFAESLQAARAGDDIEYIQPDFELSFSALLLAVEEITDTEEPETTPEPNPVPTPEPTEEPEHEEELEEEAEESEPPSSPVVVAVIDTGVDLGHSILDGYMHPDSVDVYDSNNPYESAHGTHIAGLIAQAARENGGDVFILSLPVFQNGMACTSEIIAAI
jgi:hypothetical protein